MADDGEPVDAAATAAAAAPAAPTGRDPVAERAVDLVVAAVLVATWVLWSRWTADGWFFLDEWYLASRGRSLGDFFRPYNDHLSVTYIAVYRAHLGLFGFERYELLRALGHTALLATPALLYVTTRGPLGAGWAGAAAVAVAWTIEPALEPGAMNHWGVLACAVVGAWAVRRRDPGADRWIAAALVLGLLTAGGMVAAAIGMAGYCLVGGATMRRWACVLVPTAAWFAWYLQQERGAVPAELRIGRRDVVGLVVDGHVETLRGLALGNAVLGWLLAAGFLAVVALRLRTYGRPGLVPVLAWGAASMVWWVGLARTRQALADPQTFRYRLVCSVFLLLALVPPEAPRRAVAGAVTSRLRLPAGRWVARAAAPAAVALVAAVLVAGNLGDNRARADVLETFGIRVRLQALVAMADPPVMPADARLGPAAADLTRAEVEQLRDWYGPPGLSGVDLDRALVDAGAFQVEPFPDDGEVACTGGPGPVEVGPAGLVLEGDAVEQVVSAHRFGDRPVPVAVAPVGDRVLLRPVDLPVDGAWVVVGVRRCTPVPA